MVGQGHRRARPWIRKIQYRERESVSQRRQPKIGPSFRLFVKKCIEQNLAGARFNAAVVTDKILRRAKSKRLKGPASFFVDFLPTNIPPEARRQIVEELAERAARQKNPPQA